MPSKKFATDIEILGLKTVKGIRPSTANGEAVAHEQLQGLQGALTVNAGSAGYISISGGEISIDDRLVTSVTVDDGANMTLTAFFAQGGINYADYQESDLLYFSDPLNYGENLYVHMGGTADDNTDWRMISTAVNANIVQSFFTAGEVTSASIQFASFNPAGASGTITQIDTVQSAIEKLVYRSENIDFGTEVQQLAVLADTPDTLTHQLFSTDVFVSALDVSGANPVPVMIDWFVADAMNITIESSVAITALRVCIHRLQ